MFTFCQCLADLAFAAVLYFGGFYEPVHHPPCVVHQVETVFATPDCYLAMRPTATSASSAASRVARPALAARSSAPPARCAEVVLREQEGREVLLRRPVQ